jgi:uncharacterized protein with PIN domain/sulfur carrier protein ThiS
MTQQVIISFFEVLTDFISAEQDETDNHDPRIISHQLKQQRSVKDLFESIGVPHTEVDVIIVNDQSVDFDYLVNTGDKIEVYPVHSNCLKRNHAEQTLLHCVPADPDVYRFILDVHLGRLASYLRMLGFDVLYKNQCDDEELAEISARQARILLTCDRLLLMRKIVKYGYFVRSRNIDEQLPEVVRRYQLQQKLRPFTRCMSCNGLTHPVDKSAIEHLLEPGTGKYYDEFYQCDSCQKVYWRGNHFERMQSIIDKLRSQHT